MIEECHRRRCCYLWIEEHFGRTGCRISSLCSDEIKIFYQIVLFLNKKKKKKKKKKEEENLGVLNSSAIVAVMFV